MAQDEYKLSPNMTIISHTDGKSIITHCNHDFVQASGYSLEELIGKPHNILRHPDMPKEAFRDLWDTLKRGKPWSGIIKNRRKDGGYYWVRATITPLPDKSGYTSVRVMPTTEEVSSAQALYKRMAKGEKIKLREGRVANASLNPLDRLNICQRLWLMTLAPIAFILALTLKYAGSEEILFSSALGVMLILLIAISVIRYLTATLKQTAETSIAIATGNLLQPIPASLDDEIGALVASIAIMRNNQHEVIATLKRNSEVLTQFSNRLSASATNGAQTAVSQYEAVSSMSEATEKLLASFESIGDRVNNVTSASERSSAVADTGGQIIHDAAEEMRKLGEAVHTTAQSIQQLEEMSLQITGIVNVIREIATQTNLLALNAAIEAARAGDGGRGFAVVADEVRKLAVRTAESTCEIAAMIGKIQAGTANAVINMDTAVVNAAEGVKLAHKTGDSVIGIRTEASQVCDAVIEITRVLKEQALAAKDISQHIVTVSHGAINNSIAADETALLAEQIKEISAALSQTTEKFKI
ncbi:PAS domain-containing methyl-accepting chemotaxis protein [Methylomonas sp. HYX-M1]|uniref:methyl-accepting chemotaxis protein n=1 Tax=Methylomonas sp. HYX-M1 TaxID=3139307 RepID=UPI00345B89C7